MNNIHSDQSQRPVLEIAIPTYNRVTLLGQTLSSLVDSLANAESSLYAKLSISIHNNSTHLFAEYNSLIMYYQEIFSSLGVSFCSCITGVNIGAVQNQLGLVLSSSAKYIWILPDDDLVAPDAVQTILELLTKNDYSLIIGSMKHQQISIPYSFQYANCSLAENMIPNTLCKLFVYPSSIEAFLTSNKLVAFQEMIFNLDSLKDYIYKPEYLNFVDEFAPFTFSLFCLQSRLPFAGLSSSIAYFRDGDPHSEWRHLWFKMLLQDWPRLIRSLGNTKLIPDQLFELAYHQIIVDAGIYPYLSARIDKLLGVNKRFGINPFVAFFNYPFFFVKSFLGFPFHFVRLCLHKYSLRSAVK